MTYRQQSLKRNRFMEDAWAAAAAAMVVVVAAFAVRTIGVYAMQHFFPR